MSSGGGLRPNLDQAVVMHTGASGFYISVDGVALTTSRNVSVRFDHGLAVVSMELLTRSFTTCHHDPEDKDHDSADRVRT